MKQSIAAYPELQLYIDGNWKSADGQPVIKPGVEVGNLPINHFVASTAETPFGGVKESGYGREGGTEGLECYHARQERVASDDVSQRLEMPIEIGAMRVPNTRMLACLAATLLMMSGVAAARAEELVLYGAGSLREVMAAIATDFSKNTGIPVRTSFGPSGLMRGKIEAGDRVDLFASADMGHPVKLQKDGRATSVVMFTRNRLCAFAKPDAGLTTANFAERLIDPAVKLGTSTPDADPAGDYTWQMFRLIDKARPGAFATLDSKARKVDGGAVPNSSDPDPTGSAFARGEINVMIAYCSGVERRQRATPDAQVVHVPDSLAVGPEYGLAILNGATPAAAKLAFAILSAEGQATLARFGFDPVGLPARQ